MRLSAMKDDPGHEEWSRLRAERRRVVVYLDDVIQPDAITADTEMGFVIVGARDHDGNLFVDQEHGDRIATETRRGVVRIEVDP
jgi:hypothetical protein